MSNFKETIKKISSNLVKIILCAIVIALGAYIFTCEGFSSYYNTKTYDVQAEIVDNQVSFVSKGNLLTWAKNVDGKVRNLDMPLVRGEKYTIDLENFEGEYKEDLASHGAGQSLSSVNLHFVYTWITIPAVVLLGFNGAFMLAALFMICYAIWHLESGIGLLKQGGAVRWPAAITMSGAMLLYYNPLSKSNTLLDKFSRNIGYGVSVDYDISKVIGNFTRWIGAFVGLAFLYMIFFRVYGEKIKNEKERNCWECAHKFFILAMILMILRCLRFFYNAEESVNLFSYSNSLINLVLLSFFAYFLFRLSRKVSFEKYIWTLLGVNNIALPIAIAVSDRWADGLTLFAVQVVSSIIVILFMCFIPYRTGEEKSERNISTWTAIFLSAIPLVTSLYIEALAILNQHSIFIAAVKKLYLLGMALLLMVAFVLPVVIKKLGNLKLDKKAICYPLFVVGVAALSVQPSLYSIYEADLYETANYSVLITDFLNHGTIPIVEHYGGHMMTSVWEGIIYGLLNKDVFGGGMSPYLECVSIITTLCFFYLLKTVWDEDMALFGALLFPFAGYWDYYGQGMLIALAVLSFAKKNSFPRAIWIWVAFGWVTLYRLDMGTAFGVATIVTLFAYCYINKNKDAAKKLVFSFLLVALVALTAWVVICIIKYVNPATRLLEFIKASASNQTWARDTLGDTAKADFSWGYIFIPMGVALGVGYTLISKRFRLDAGEDRYLLLLMFGVSYVANIQRSLVRHTLAASNYRVVLWSSLIFLALFLSVKKTRNAFLPAFGAMIIFAGLLGSQDAYSELSVMENASTRLSSHIDSWNVDRISLEDATNEIDTLTLWQVNAFQGNVVDRVQLTEESQEKIAVFEEAMNTLLDEGETYLDFENHTFLYSATGRKNPVYVSQSPMQISGEFMQKQFINEAEMGNVPLAILPATGISSFASIRLDGLENASRYYLISEYIYSHFIPLCSTGEYAIWVRPDKYDEKLEKINDLVETEQLPNMVAGFSYANMEIENTDEGMILTAVKADPFVSGLENCIDLSDYVGGNVKFSIDYNTTAHGNLQLYYTTSKDESFSEEKSVKEFVSGAGTIEMVVPVSNETRLRFDIPEGTVFTIKSFRTSSSMKMIDYGYDIFGKAEGNDNLLTDESAHIYNLWDLPRIWGELDSKDAAEGEVLLELEQDADLYRNNNIRKIDKNGSNYLLIEMTYSGKDEVHSGDDEYAEVTLRAGKKDGTGIVENARYNFFANEGTHTYLIRLSSDYSWRTNDLNTFRLDSDECVTVNKMQIIQGE